MLRPDAIWKFNGTSYTDLTDSIRTNSAITFMAAAIDIFYIGLKRRFTGLYIDLFTNGSYTELAFNYVRGESDLVKLSLIDSYTFNVSKYLRWNLPADWARYNFTSTYPHSVAPPDTEERYWIKISCTTAPTTAVISKIRCIPYALYTDPIKVSEFLQVKNNFSSSTKPTDLVVEDMIRRSEDRIDYRTRKSWRFSAVSEEISPRLVDYNRYGVFLRHRNFQKVYSVSLWDGNDWQVLTEGRGSDYFVNYDLGMIYFTRLFLLPAVYGLTGRYFQYGFGEFKNSIKVDYVYGRDAELDREFFIVEDIATKMVAKDLLKHHDYSALIASGSDKVSLESKVRLLEEECEQRLDELQGVFLI